MPSRSPRGAGFSLIELMIAVAIIGVLAVIAIPNFVRYQLRARTSEATTHLRGIATAEQAYYAEYGTYVSVSTPVPASVPGGAGTPWSSGGDFDVLGWGAEGNVRFQYKVGADAAGGSGGLVRFSAEARGDVDGDGRMSFFGFVKPTSADGGLDGSFPGTTCVGAGVFSGSGTDALEVAGPCDAASGRTVF